MKFNTVIIASIILLMGFTSNKSDLPVEYYHNLQYIKYSSPPKAMKMVLINNLNKNMPIISSGILLSYKNRTAKNVYIAGNFSQWKTIKMTRNKNSVWHYFLDDTIIDTKIKYKFNVDGIWILDPKNFTREDDGIGSYYSVVNFTRNDDNKHITYKIIRKNLVEFRIFRPHARLISVVGDFNNWNPENDLLAKDSNGVWRLKKRIPSGIYRYKYIVDGNWELDIYNKNSAADNIGDACSVLNIK